jgi:hypothetical protein
MLNVLLPLFAPVVLWLHAASAGPAMPRAAPARISDRREIRPSKSVTPTSIERNGVVATRGES